MNAELNGIFSRHAEWLESEGESGNQLVLDNISSEQLTSEQLQLLTDSILTECSFTDIVLNEIDLYHTEMYSCKFSKTSFRKVQLIKSEVNDTEFTDISFEYANFSNAEFFDCNFLRSTFDNSTFVSVGIWNRLGSDPALLWLWRRPAATAPIRPLAWEPPYATGAALENRAASATHSSRQRQILNPLIKARDGT